MFRNAAEKVKMRGKQKIEVFGLKLYISCVKYQKDGRTKYLIIANPEANKYAIEEYKVRWQNRDALGGCLKARGFNF